MKKMFVILAAMFAATAVHAALNPVTCVDPCNSEKAWVCHKQSNSPNHLPSLIHPNRSATTIQGHLTHPHDFCATIVGACNFAQNGLNKYKNMTFSCGNGPVPTPLENPLDIPCGIDGTCETKIESSATFDFAIASGGVNQALYVCEVGFRLNDCENCNKGVDKIVVHRLADVTPKLTDITISYPNSQTFTPEEMAGLADVYLNSLDYSAGWFVRYCSKTTRLVVGEGISGGGLAAKIKASVLVDASENEDNGYLAEAAVKFGVTHECNALGESFFPVTGYTGPTPATALLTPNSALEIKTEDFLCMNGTGVSCAKEECNWVVHFQETACTLRKIKDITCPPGSLVCTPFKAEISTALNLETTFECVTTGSNCL